MTSKITNRMKFIFLVLLFFFNFSNFSEAQNRVIMITADYCLYCKIWEKEIGKIYPKTEIAKNYPLHRLDINNFSSIKYKNFKKTNITPTFIFLVDEIEKGRIIGYSNPEMFWWQVDEIIDQ